MSQLIKGGSLDGDAKNPKNKQYTKRISHRAVSDLGGHSYPVPRLLMLDSWVQDTFGRSEGFPPWESLIRRD